MNRPVKRRSITQYYRFTREEMQLDSVMREVRMVKRKLSREMKKNPRKYRRDSTRSMERFERKYGPLQWVDKPISKIDDGKT